MDTPLLDAAALGKLDFLAPVVGPRWFPMVARACLADGGRLPAQHPLLRPEHLTTLPDSLQVDVVTSLYPTGDRDRLLAWDGWDPGSLARLVGALIDRGHLQPTVALVCDDRLPDRLRRGMWAGLLATRRPEMKRTQVPASAPSWMLEDLVGLVRRDQLPYVVGKVDDTAAVARRLLSMPADHAGAATWRVASVAHTFPARYRRRLVAHARATLPPKVADQVVANLTSEEPVGAKLLTQTAQVAGMLGHGRQAQAIADLTADPTAAGRLLLMSAPVPTGGAWDGLWRRVLTQSTTGELVATATRTVSTWGGRGPLVGLAGAELRRRAESGDVEALEHLVSVPRAVAYEVTSAVGQAAAVHLPWSRLRTTQTGRLLASHLLLQLVADEPADVAETFLRLLTAGGHATVPELVDAARATGLATAS